MADFSTLGRYKYEDKVNAHTLVSKPAQTLMSYPRVGIGAGVAPQQQNGAHPSQRAALLARLLRVGSSQLESLIA